MSPRSVATAALVLLLLPALLTPACAGSGDDDDDDVDTTTLEDTFAGNPDADVLAYEEQLELNLATPQLDNLAGLHWGNATPASLLQDSDVLDAIDVLSATPQLAIFGEPNCDPVFEAVGDAAASIAAFFSSQGLTPACNSAPDAVQCIAASFLVVARAVDPDASSGAAVIAVCAAEGVPTPTGSASPSPTASETATASPTASGTTSATPSATESPTPSPTSTAVAP